MFQPASRVHVSGLKNSILMLIREVYYEEHCNIGETYARFAFCDDLDALHAAV